MEDEAGHSRRRRRHRATTPAGPPPAARVAPPEPRAPVAAPEPRAPVAAPEPQAPIATAAPVEKPPAASRRPRGPRDDGDRGALRDLAGSGRSQLGVSGALRARDVNRPSDDDLAAAERDIVIVRRNWRPDDRDAR